MRIFVMLSLVTMLIHMDVQGASIDQYLPKADRFTATLYEFTDSVRADQLVEKMVNARSKDGGWYDEYRRTHVGKALPYHPRLGLSEAEYEELQDELDKRTLRPSMSVNFEVEWANSEVVLRAGGPPTMFDALEIRGGDGYVLTSYARLTEVATVESPSGPLGPFSGMEWKNEVLGESEGGFSVSFMIGVYEAKRAGMIKYSVDAVRPDGDRENFDMFLTYSLE